MPIYLRVVDRKAPDRLSVQVKMFRNTVPRRRSAPLVSISLAVFGNVVNFSDRRKIVTGRSFPMPSAWHLDPHHPCRSGVGKTLSGPFGANARLCHSVGVSGV